MKIIIKKFSSNDEIQGILYGYTWTHEGDTYRNFYNVLTPKEVKSYFGHMPDKNEFIKAVKSELKSRNLILDEFLAFDIVKDARDANKELKFLREDSGSYRYDTNVYGENKDWNKDYKRVLLYFD